MPSHDHLDHLMSCQVAKAEKPKLRQNSTYPKKGTAEGPIFSFFFWGGGHNQIFALVCVSCVVPFVLPLRRKW